MGSFKGSYAVDCEELNIHIRENNTLVISKLNDQELFIRTMNSIATANIATEVVTGNANVANLQLNRFQETVYNYGNASGTITPDFNNGSIQQLLLTGNITLNSLGNALAGRSMTLILTQDSTAGRTLTSSWLYASGTKTLSVSACLLYTSDAADE